MKSTSFTPRKLVLTNKNYLHVCKNLRGRRVLLEGGVLVSVYESYCHEFVLKQCFPLSLPGW